MEWPYWSFWLQSWVPCDCLYMFQEIWHDTWEFLHQNWHMVWWLHTPYFLASFVHISHLYHSRLMPLWHCLIPHNQWTGASCHGWKCEKYLYFQSIQQVLICFEFVNMPVQMRSSARWSKFCLTIASVDANTFLLNDCLAFCLLEKDNHFQNVAKMICSAFP